jgi:hypothetical protein
VSVAGPGYWMNEQSGVLRPVMEAYLEGRHLTARDVAVMRGYLRQWIAAPLYRGEEVDALRASVDGIMSPADITRWLDRAFDAGVDLL